MATPQEFQRIQDRAYRLWEQEGRPCRQQTHADQSLQSGSEELDRRASRQSSGVENR